MDTRFIDSLIAVAEEGSIAGAARSQMITAAAVSQRILSLEREFKCKLFSRAGNTVQPTDACLTILPKAKSFVREARYLLEAVQVSGFSGTLRIGANSTSLAAFIPATLKSIRASAPEAKFHITPDTSIGLYRSLIDGDIDTAIMVMPASTIPKSLRYWILRDEPLVLIHHKSIKGTITEILDSNPYIRYDPTCWGGQMSELYMIEKGMTKNTIFDLDSLEAITQLVSEEVGVSLVPVWAGLEQYSETITSVIIPDRKYDRKLILMHAYHPRQPRLQELFMKHLSELESIDVVAP
ncbi:LysR family transcriptional regulator [Moritella sp. 28]|uniref:LysR family transcriptional regulator n=1 Tax=Moritella sp. 28 TaxID=2746232 RepID=UPI001BA53702|nr:LysR family transcriptional regulator [Moritella sp. 28]QUM84043.1 LysR family transcriptional regulator [Moritella sp. 28]